MKGSNILGVVGGMVFTTIGLICAPSPSYDPAGWGQCGALEVFPIRQPMPEPTPNVERPFCFHCYECVVGPGRVLWLLAYLTVVFMISGALAARIGERMAPTRGALSVGLIFGPTLLFMALTTGGVDVLLTALVGAALFVAAASLAYGGGLLAQRHA